MNYNQDTSSPIRFTPGKDSSYRSNSDVGTKPTGDPRGSKNFKKILEKTKDDGNDDQSGNAAPVAEAEDYEMPTYEDSADTNDTSTSTKNAPLSLFDLTSGKAPGAGKIAKNVPVDATPKTTPSLFASLIPKKPGADDRVDDAAFAPVNEASSSSTTTTDNKFTTRFSTEQADLSYINPLAAVTSQPVDGVQTDVAKPVLSTTNIQDIINQLVAKVEELKNGGQTETTVTLRNPPMFAGANIVLSEFDSAKGQFNISFENLTQEAKNMLDLRSNQQSLMLALEQKGYTVQMITTTTLMEHRPVIAEAQEGRPGGQQRERDQDQGQGRQQRRNG